MHLQIFKFVLSCNKNTSLNYIQLKNKRSQVVAFQFLLSLNLFLLRKLICEDVEKQSDGIHFSKLIIVISSGINFQSCGKRFYLLKSVLSEFQNSNI